MIAAAITFLRPYVKPLAGALLVLAVLGAALFMVHRHGYQAGVSAEVARNAKALARAEKRVKEGEKRAEAANTAIATKHVQTVEKIRWRTQTLTKEVAVYVPQTVDRVAFISNGSISLHNAAVDGSELPETPSGPFEAPSGIAQSQFVATVISNYGTCHTWESEVDTWRKWYVDQRAIYEKATGTR